MPTQSTQLFNIYAEYALQQGAIEALNSTLNLHSNMHDLKIVSIIANQFNWKLCLNSNSISRNFSCHWRKVVEKKTVKHVN